MNHYSLLFSFLFLLTSITAHTKTESDCINVILESQEDVNNFIILCNTTNSVEELEDHTHCENNGNRGVMIINGETEQCCNDDNVIWQTSNAIALEFRGCLGIEKSKKAVGRILRVNHNVSR